MILKTPFLKSSPHSVENFQLRVALYRKILAIRPDCPSVLFKLAVSISRHVIVYPEDLIGTCFEG